MTMQTKSACPCCGFLTISQAGAYEICPVCFWEDDGQNDATADEVWGGPNGELSLSAARSNFSAFGASSKCVLNHVRDPLPGELRGAL
jgi:hypothetical protein